MNQSTNNQFGLTKEAYKLIEKETDEYKQAFSKGVSDALNNASRRLAISPFESEPNQDKNKQGEPDGWNWAISSGRYKEIYNESNLYVETE